MKTVATASARRDTAGPRTPPSKIARVAAVVIVGQKSNHAANTVRKHGRVLCLSRRTQGTHSSQTAPFRYQTHLCTVTGHRVWQNKAG